MVIGGLDVGTTGCKIALYDENGAHLHTYYQEYDVRRNGGEHEISFLDVKVGVLALLKQAVSEYRVEALGVTSFGESFVMLDDDDEILAPAMLYTDPRGAEECRELCWSLGEEQLTLLTGVKPNQMYSIAKMMWLKKHKTHLFKQCKRILLGEDFIVYAYMLETVGELYADDTCTSKAQKLKKVIRQRSYTDKFFCDNEIYQDGNLVLSGECTETCQYYAFFTGVATRELYPELWQIITDQFGPDRMKKGLLPEIHPSNAFIGNYLRMILLNQYGKREQMLEELKGYFLYMADNTGTLWEMRDEKGSCNHGFASYAAALIGECFV